MRLILEELQKYLCCSYEVNQNMVSELLKNFKVEINLE